MSFLPICSKIFEKLIFHGICEFVNKNNLFNNNQSGFRPNDSCLHQLLAITHNIFSAFDAYPSLEDRGLFLDISKVFDRVWHDLYELKINGIDGNLFKLIKSLLNNRCQRVVPNGQSSVWKSVTAGVPLGSFLGESAKLRAYVVTCLACLHAHVPCVLTRSCVNLPCVLMCQLVLRANVL